MCSLPPHACNQIKLRDRGSTKCETESVFCTFSKLQLEYQMSPWQRYADITRNHKILLACDWFFTQPFEKLATVSVQSLSITCKWANRIYEIDNSVFLQTLTMKPILSCFIYYALQIYNSGQNHLDQSTTSSIVPLRGISLCLGTLWCFVSDFCCILKRVYWQKLMNSPLGTK